MIDYVYFELQNPWWENKDAINNDEKIKEFNKLKYRFRPDNVLEIPLYPGDIHVITGPRQTGKSTALKLYIHKLIRTKYPAPAILYFNCDAISSEKEIINLVVEYQKLHQYKQIVIFLDEISSVDKWPQAIKWLADTGLLRHTTLFLTGSSSINLKKSGELLPGRRGQGKDITFLPITFYEYINLMGENIKKISIHDNNLISTLIRLNDKLIKHYKNFLQTGGFLRNINYGLSESQNDLYIKTIKSELYKSGKKEDNLREVIRKLLSSLSSQTSYTNIAEEAELGSKNTAIDYLCFLSDSFFIRETKFYDIKSKRVVLKKNKKYYTTDPYILWLFEGLISGNLNFIAFSKLHHGSVLAENFIASELVKSGNEFFFYQNAREMDFYLPAKEIGIEVKYKDRITSEDIKPLVTVKNKILVSKRTLAKKNDVLIIPTHLFPLIRY